MGAPAVEPLVRRALRATGTGLRVFDPIENRTDRVLDVTGEPRETIEDPALASWLFGASWVADQGPWARTFSIWRAPNRPVRAWLAPLDVMPEVDDARRLVGRCPGDVGHPRRPEAAGGRVGTARGMDHFRRGRRAGLGDRVAARRPAVDGPLDRRGRTRNAIWQDPAGLPQGVATRGLAVFRGSPAGPLDATARIRRARRGGWGAISTIAWLSWMLAAVFTAFQTWRGTPVPARDQTEA